MPSGATSSSTASTARRFRHLLGGLALTAALFTFVLGGNWAVVAKWGSDMPNWDQWDAEATELLIPWLEQDTRFLQHLFHPHNEHRVVVTKLQHLSLALWSGQWDARLESISNAALHALLAIGFWLLARRWLTPAFQIGIFVVVAALYGLPVSWQNMIAGFHSQQYWLLLFSFAAIVWLPNARPWSKHWFLGVFCAILALLTMGSGCLAAATVFALVLLQLIRRESSLRDAWPTLVTTIVLTAVGLLTRVDAPQHEPLKAKTVHDFVFSIVHSLQWPFGEGYAAFALLLWLPWLLALWRIFVAPEKRVAGRTIVGLGAWVLLQFAATAYARGVGAAYPSPRYFDTPVFGAATNALALGWLLSISISHRMRKAFVWIGAAWCAVLIWGLVNVIRFDLSHELPQERSFFIEAERHLRGYLATNDPAQLAFANIPYPNADALVERLSHAELRKYVPASVREPLALRASASLSQTWGENLASELSPAPGAHLGLSLGTVPYASRRTWGSFGNEGLGSTGEWRSEPLTAPLGGYLQFETAGHLGESGVALELRDAATDAVLADIRPTKVPGEAWRTAYVRAPHNSFVVVARDADTQRWLAFSAPVEMSSVSYWAWRIAKHGLVVAQMSALAAMLLGLWQGWRRYLGRDIRSTWFGAHDG